MRHCGRCKSLAWPATCSAIPSLWQHGRLCPVTRAQTLTRWLTWRRCCGFASKLARQGLQVKLILMGSGSCRGKLAFMLRGKPHVEALKFIHFILSHKVHHGILPTMPELSVDVIGGNLRNLPEPCLNNTAVVDPAPKPFSVVPPRGRRHVLAQLEKKGVEVEGEDSQAREEEQDEEEQHGGSCYVFSVFGGIYPFRARFGENSIAGAHVKLGADGDGGREYLRYMSSSGAWTKAATSSKLSWRTALPACRSILWAWSAKVIRWCNGCCSKAPFAWARPLLEGPVDGCGIKFFTTRSWLQYLDEFFAKSGLSNYWVELCIDMYCIQIPG